MPLFDPGPRTEFRWKNESEPTFAYYNQSARPAVAAFREMIEGWFNRFRDEDKKDLYQRFRSPNEPNHLGAFFEIYLHELLSRLDFEVEVHPAIPDCPTHPDFVARMGGANAFYLEATLAGLPSQEEQGADARMGIVYDALNAIESPNFFLQLEIKGFPDTAPPTQRLRRDLTAWLAGLDPDYMQDLRASGRGSEVPSLPWQHEGWNLLFSPIPKSAGLRGQSGVRPIGMRVPEGGWMNTHGEIRKAVENKAKKYGELQLPFIVAVNVVGNHCDNIDIMNALYGDESILVTQDVHGRFTERYERKSNGAWFGPQGPRNTRVSGVLVFVSLNPWSMGVVTPELFHNPWAQHPLPVSNCPLPYCVADLAAECVRHENGRTAREILDLPDQWPTSDTDCRRFKPSYPDPMPHPILLYDGVCGLCNRFVQLILRRDRNAIFRFASLQSTLAARILTRHNANPTDLDTVYVVLNHELSDESLLSRSEAVLFVLKQLEGFCRPAASLLQLLPKFLRDPAYNTVARHRYRIFGRSETCTIPRGADHSRFLV